MKNAVILFYFMLISTVGMTAESPIQSTKPIISAAKTMTQKNKSNKKDQDGFNKKRAKSTKKSGSGWWKVLLGLVAVAGITLLLCLIIGWSLIAVLWVSIIYILIVL